MKTFVFFALCVTVAYCQTLSESNSIFDIPSLERIHAYQEWPTGIAVSSSKKVFTCFPRQRDDQPYTVTEVVRGRDKPFPDQTYQKGSFEDPSSWFIDAQSVTIDSSDRLWVLDTGVPFRNGTKEKKPLVGGPKIMSFNVTSGKLLRSYVMPQSALVEKSSINDVRFNLTLGKAGTAFISDTADEGAIIVVDLDSGKTIRRLSNSSSTCADSHFVGSYQNKPFYVREKGKDFKSISNGANAIALYNGKVYFSPQASNRFHSVPQELLADPNVSEQKLQESVTLVTRSPSYSTGAESDNLGRIFYGAPEQNSINYIDSHTGEVAVLISSPLLKWPDSFSQTNDGYLYVTTNDLPKWPKFNNGKDFRKPPYYLYRVKNGAKTVGF